jgi:hypothetical protein
MVRKEVEAGDVSCNHSYTRQDKKTFQILTRVCTKCGHTDLISDDANITEDMLTKLSKRS